jgi:hypothetical protein
MMRLSAFVFACLVSTAVVAQTAVPSAPATQSAQRPEFTPDQRAQFRADRKSCSDEVKPKTLAKGERGPAMRRCMEARNPAYREGFARAAQRRGEIKQVRDACREEIRGKRLARDQRREAMKTCILAKKPELAKPMACAEQARSRNLAAGTERREFMRACIRA